MYNIKQQFKKIILIPLALVICHCVYAQTISDELIKKNITPIASPLKKLLQLEPRIFEYDTDKFRSLGLKQGRQYGFLADNINDVFPGLVSSKSISYMYGKNNYRIKTINTIDEVSLIPILVASIQELHTEIEQIKMQMKELKK